MSRANLIPLDQLCTQYKVEMSFFTNLYEFGLVEISTVEQSLYIHEEKIGDIEKMIRMHQELNINFEGIDTVLNLLAKMEDLQTQLRDVKNRLRLYED